MAALEEAGAAPFAARPFSELSDGERQKVLMARALAQECPLVLLDEPTVYLDAPSRREGLALLRRLTRDRGKTAIIALHEIDLALEWGDELWIASPKDGRLISGLPETLALSGSLSRAFGTDPSSAARDYAGNPSVLGVLFPFEEKSGERRSCALSGPEGAARYWISRLLRRKGYDVPETAGPGDLIVSYAPDESGRLRFSLRDGRAESSGEGLDGLDSLLGP
jgi:iron complex transport system ATP-binding protein